MAIRRGLGGALSGAGGAIADLGDSMLKQRIGQQNAAAADQRTTLRSLLKDYSDRVAKGEMDPDQAEQAMALQGMRVPQGYFASVAPSTEHQVKDTLGPILSATTQQQIPGEAMLSAMLPKQATTPVLGTEAHPATEDTLPSTSLQPQRNPIMDKLLAITEEKRASLPPTRIETTDASGQGATTFERPDRLTGRTFPKEATPEQGAGLQRRKLEAQGAAGIPQMEGEAEAAKNLPIDLGKLNPVLTAADIAKQNAVTEGTTPTKIAAANATTIGTTPTNIAAENQTIRGTAGAKAGAAAQQTAATTQAGIDVNTKQSNVEKVTAAEVYAQTEKEKAKQALIAQGLGPETAQSYLYTGALTKTPYAFVDPTLTPTEGSAIKRVIREASPGIRFVSRPQAEALTQVATASDTLNTMLKDFEPYAAKSSSGRAIQVPANILGKYVQSNATLGSLDAFFGPKIEIFRAVTAGVTGFRMTAQEIAKAEKAVPDPTKDSWATMQRKVMILKDVMHGFESRVIGKYEPPK